MGAGHGGGARAGISPHTLKTSLEPIGLEVACETCREALRERIQDVVNSWSAVKVRGPLCVGLLS